MVFNILSIIVIILGLYDSPTGTISLTGGDFHQGMRVLKIEKNFRAWQGVASDGTHIYLTSDRDENFKLSNTISVYTMNGVFVTEKTKAYTETDQRGLFMSFGDCYIIDGYLYATVYNFNSGPSTEERISRIVKYSLPNLKQVDEFNIGYGTAESLAKFNNTYWIVYHDLNEIRQFNKDFNLIRSYPYRRTLEMMVVIKAFFLMGMSYTLTYMARINMEKIMRKDWIITTLMVKSLDLLSG